MTTTTAMPSIEEIDARLSVQVMAYQQAQNKIARLSLVQALLVTRDFYPTATGVSVETTDQDMSGALVAVAALDAAGAVLGTDATWEGQMWDPLINLDDRVEAIRAPFILTMNGARRLDLTAIERQAAELLKG